MSCKMKFELPKMRTQADLIARLFEMGGGGGWGGGNKKQTDP